MRVDDFFNFISKRHAVYRKRIQGLPKPWTEDPILQNYRFCNVYRRLDTETRWFNDNWARQDDNLWFAALVFRFINWHETAAELGYPVPFNVNRFKKVARRRKERGDKVYNGAYIISTHGRKQEKHEYLAEVLRLAWADRKYLQYEKGETLKSWHARLMSCYGVGSFLAAQVVADCKYHAPISKAPDWWTFAASGPGSRRGLNRVAEFETNDPWKEEEWHNCILMLKPLIDEKIMEAYLPAMHAQDLQNCLCEFDKYERVRLGEGRPKSRYNGGADESN